MKLWSFQPKIVAERLSSGIPYFCDPTLSDFLTNNSTTDEFTKAYRWIISKMDQVLEPSENTHPAWAWFKHNSENKKPDRRLSIFNNYGRDYDLLELEIDESRVLLSDWFDWHSVLSDFPVLPQGTWEDDDKLYEMTESAKFATWDQILVTGNSAFVQACVWEFRPDDLVNIYQVK